MKYYPTARMIFLVRDPRSAIGSHYWRFQSERRFHFLRKNHFLPRWMGPIVLTLAAASWTIGNLLGELAVRVAPERVLILRYEDLRDRPKEPWRASPTRSELSSAMSATCWIAAPWWRSVTISAAIKSGWSRTSGSTRTRSALDRRCRVGWSV